MSKESPLFLTKVECPVCKTINEFETIKVGAYVEDDHDTDFCPKGRRWHNPKYAIYNPLLFFMATCENCYYTREFNQTFRDWKNDTAFRTFRQKGIQSRHLEALAVDGSILKTLGQSRDPQGNPFGTAVVKFLLGIYDELLNEHPHKLDVGRFYLRIAWLYREQLGESNVTTSQSVHFAHDIEKAYAKLKQARDTLAANVSHVSDLVATVFSDREGAMEQSAEFLSVGETLKANLARIAEQEAAFATTIAQMGQTVEGNNRVLHHRPESGRLGAIGFGGYPSLEDFLRQDKTNWEFAPLNEHDALFHAIEFYKSALEEGHEIQPGNQQIQATYLIAELSRRVSRNVEAKLYFNNTIKAGQQFIFDNRGDQTRTALAKRITELALAQGRANLAAIKGD
jgi:uncharacterized protein (DUF2225 family)